MGDILWKTQEERINNERTFGAVFYFRRAFCYFGRFARLGLVHEQQESQNIREAVRQERSKDILLPFGTGNCGTRPFDYIGDYYLTIIIVCDKNNEA